ncbi:Nuclear nucleic acid-binding protein C1D [Trichuris trichiura]|uniref:Nuclear nucleic acid-binding protein C1D n=1 Tax=Trichuris trichiura TaxID=36087 RepID=A0A077ZD54_TRITR|nr:Nuclear nucleic acid-binding protein C1D [Trichuris trichiura]
MDENSRIDKYVDLHKMVDELQELVQRYTEKPFVDRMTEQSNLQNARTNVELMYVVNALFWCQLRLQNCDAAKHPIMKELNNIKQKLNVIKEIELRGKGPKIDAAAAKRLIQHDLWSLKSTEYATSGGNNQRHDSRKREYSKSSEEEEKEFEEGEEELSNSSSDNQPATSSRMVE